MKNFDFSKFKKIDTDKASTTLKHPDGHEIRIAHKGLSHKMKADLDKIPLQMAQGSMTGNAGGVNEEETRAFNQPPEGKSSYDMAHPTQPPVSININSGPATPPPTPLPPPMADAPAPAPALAAKPPGQPQQGAMPAGPAPAQAPAPAPNQVPAPSPQGPAPQAHGETQEAPQQDVKQNVSQFLSEQDQKWAQDLANQHIEPKTYSDMFAKHPDGSERGTLSKIGTLFGLLLGGAGSGLTHQPNALMAMMDKQIANDLDAQKKSKENAQNYLRINQQALMNQAQVEQLKKQGSLTQTQEKQLKVETDIKAYALSQAQMLQASYHKMVSDVNKMPEGKEKENAKQNLGIIYGKIGEKITNINDQAAGAVHYYNTLFGNGGGSGGGDEQEFRKKTTGMRMLGPQGEKRAEDMEAKHFPGVKEPSTIPIAGDDRSRVEAMNVLDDKVKDVLDFAKKHRGSVDPAVLARAKQKAEELTSFYNKSTDSLGMTQGRLGWLEEQIKKNPTSLIQQIMGNNERLKEIRDSNVGRRDILMKSKYGIKEYPKESGGSKSAETKVMNGVSYEKVPGGWQKVK